MAVFNCIKYPKKERRNYPKKKKVLLDGEWSEAKTKEETDKGPKGYIFAIFNCITISDIYREN